MDKVHDGSFGRLGRTNLWGSIWSTPSQSTSTSKMLEKKYYNHYMSVASIDEIFEGEHYGRYKPVAPNDEMFEGRHYDHYKPIVPR